MADSISNGHKGNAYGKLVAIESLGCRSTYHERTPHECVEIPPTRVYLASCHGRLLSIEAYATETEDEDCGALEQNG
jgi:hypothetical protein